MRRQLNRDNMATDMTEQIQTLDLLGEGTVSILCCVMQLHLVCLVDNRQCSTMGHSLVRLN